MDAYPRSRTWPYVALVLLFFVLAIAYPKQRTKRPHRYETPSRSRTWMQRKPNSEAKLRRAKRPTAAIDAERRVHIDFRPAWQIAERKAERQRQQLSLQPVPMQSPIANRYIPQDDAPVAAWNPPLDSEPPFVLEPAEFIRLARRRIAVEPAPAFDHAEVPGTAEFPRKKIQVEMVAETETTVRTDDTSPLDAGGVEPDTQLTDLNPQSESDSTATIAVSKPEVDLAATESAAIESSLPDQRNSSRSRVVDDGVSTMPTAWPKPSTLRGLLSKLEPDAAQVAEWSQNVGNELQQLQAQADLTAPGCVDQLDRLAELSSETKDLEVYLSQSERVLLRRINYAILRRLAIWRAAQAWAAADGDAIDELRVSETYGVLQDVEQKLDSHTHTRAWRNYLMLDKLQQISTETWSADSSTRRKTARQVLTRLDEMQLTEEQRQVIIDPVFATLKQHLHRWAAPSKDVSALLRTIEQFEDTRSAAVAEQLADVMNSLAYSAHPAAAKLRSELNTHYRNANIRLTLTGELLNDLMPVLQPIQQRIKDTILGAAVTGRNQTSTDLNLRLVKDDDQIRIRIEADGTSRSRTVSTKGPVRFLSRDQARFNAGKDLIVSPRGIFVSRANALANNRTELLGVESDYDQIPLLGWIVRQIAIDEHREHRPQVKNEVQRRVERRASNTLDRSIHERLAGAETRIDETILEPLRALQLDPRAIEMRTTDRRAVMRLRLAGPEQLAAYTPRPRALSNNLLSMQLHESAANNMLDQLNLDDKGFQLENLIAELNQKLRIERTDLHEEIPEGVEIRLGSERPIQFEFADDRVLVSIKVKRLKTPKRLYRNFVVRGRYRADVSQTHVDLQRDGGIELISEQIGFRDQIALRGIFTKVMTRDHRLNIIQGRVKENARLKKLGVTQFVVRNGWIGVSVGPMHNHRVARQ